MRNEKQIGIFALKYEHWSIIALVAYTPPLLSSLTKAEKNQTSLFKRLHLHKNAFQLNQISPGIIN